MANLTVDSWALHRLTLDFADQFVPGTLIANAADANGRGIDLYITDNGEAVTMTNMKVYLLWRHSNGNQGQTQFTAVNAATGPYKVYYPAGMMYEGLVTARISIYIGTTTPITGSRDFRINVERNPIDEGEAMASDDFSAFTQATIDLNSLLATATAAENARVSAESARVTAENARAAAETARASEHATLKSQSQQATSNAVTAAATAETAAQNANAAAAATANVIAEAVEALSNDTQSEAAQIKVLAIQLAETSQNYIVLGETLYTPSSKSTVAGEAVTRTSASVSGENATLS